MPLVRWARTCHYCGKQKMQTDRKGGHVKCLSCYGEIIRGERDDEPKYAP